MRTAYRRPIATSLLLVGAMLFLAGCGDEGAHLPAGMTGSSAAYAGATGNGMLDDALGGDPGPSTVGYTSNVDDPVMAGYDGLDSVDGLGTDDVYGRALNDWNETEGALGGLNSDIDDEFADDDFLPAGYGGGSGYGYGDDLGLSGGYGYGNGLMAAGMNGGGWGGNAGLMDAGFDPGFEDPGFADAGFDQGFEDPGFVDAGFDPGIADVGMDPGFVDAGFDPGIADVGMDPGFVDAGVGGMDVGMIDAGAGIEGMVF